MIKKEYRYFFGFLDQQQDYLNRRAKGGFRLVHTGKMSYTFEPCLPGAYQYCLEFVAHESAERLKDYQDFLESMGYRVFPKNINLNWSIGKVRWRPYGRGRGQLATAPGRYNKELLIVEKENDGTPFELHTTMADKADYYRPLRNAYLCLLALAGAMAAVSGAAVPVFLSIAVLLLIPIACYQKKIIKYSKESKLRD